jgi:rhodanese-related sulfurtransferase
MKSRAAQYRVIGVVAAVAIVCVALVSGCSSGGGETSTAQDKGKASTTEAFARLDPAAFAERMNDQSAVVINVHIPYEDELEQTDAFIPYDKILGDARLPKDKDSEILLYCRSGRMSEEAGAALHDAGYTNIAHLEGGMRGWEAAGRKLIHNPAHAGQETPAPMQHS